MQFPVPEPRDLQDAFALTVTAIAAMLILAWSRAAEHQGCVEQQHIAESDDEGSDHGEDGAAALELDDAA